jgi:hypothetical protein
MYRKLICLICLMAVFAFVGAAQAAVLQNGGFEDPVAFNHWELFPGSGVTGVWIWGPPGNITSVTINTTDAYEGLACADVNVVGPGGAGVFQGVFIGGGVPVSMSAYVKIKSGFGWGLGAGGIDMVFFDLTPGEEEQCQCLPNITRVDLHFNYTVTGGNGATTLNSYWEPNDANGWRYGILNAVTPAGTRFVKFEINANNNPGEFLFDNVVSSGLEADLNEDYRVDFRDFAILGNQWFQAPGYPSADISPPGGDGIVNFEDLALLADQWLEE